MPSTRPQVPRRTWVLLFVVAAALAAVPAVRSLLDHDGDPTTLLRVGRYSAARPFVEQDFRDPVLVPDYGHDGQQFYVLAATFPDLRSADGYVDKLRYRARRILLPALVSPLPRGAPTVWGMLAINVVAVGAAAVAIGALARRLGASAWLGLSAAANPALIESVNGSLGDAPAFALALWGVVVWRRRPWAAAALFVFAALSRETALVVPLACLLVSSRGSRLALCTPFVAYGAWTVGVSLWLPAGTGSTNNLLSDALAQFDWPFAGWATVGWSDAVLLGLALLGASLYAAWALRSRLPELSLWLLFDLVLLTISAEAVVFRPENFSRVAPLAVPALALAVGARFARSPDTPSVRDAEALP